MRDNVDVAILMKLNELAERLGLKPLDFLATIRFSDGKDGNTVLTFERPAVGNALREERFARMLEMLNVNADGEMRGDDADIYRTIEDALEQIPKSRLRF